MCTRLLPVVVLCGVLSVAPAAAEPGDPVEPVHPRRERSILRAGQEQARLLATLANTGEQQTTQTPPRHAFIKRHPVLTGMLIGMAAGATIVGAAEGSEAAFVGFYGGGLLGAGTGWVLSR